MSFIGPNLSEIRNRHYLMNATAANHWYNFYSNRVASFVRNYRNDFCLIIHGSEHYDDAYVLPYSEFKDFFSEDYLDQHNRWVGTIKENRLRLTASNKPTKSISVGSYYNSFNLLDQPSRSDSPSTPNDVVVVSSDDELRLSDLQRLIAEFNQLYESVRPDKRIVVSEAVARPNAITDYLKSLRLYTCQICHSLGFVQRNGSLFAEAHHIVELHHLIPGSFCSDNVIIVCPTCHKKLHYAAVAYEAVNSVTVRVVINDVASTFQRNVVSQ